LENSSGKTKPSEELRQLHRPIGGVTLVRAIDTTVDAVFSEVRRSGDAQFDCGSVNRWTLERGNKTADLPRHLERLGSDSRPGIDSEEVDRDAFARFDLHPFDSGQLGVLYLPANAKSVGERPAGFQWRGHESTIAPVLSRLRVVEPKLCFGRELHN